MSGPVKTSIMLSSIVLGILIPEASSLSFLIKYFLMGMLFFAFLDLEFKKEIFALNHLYMVVYLVGISFVLYFVGSLIDDNLGLALFITAIAPSAISSAPVISYLKGNVGYVTFAVLVTNISIALILPFILPVILPNSTDISLMQLVVPVFSVVFIPLAISVVVKYFIRPVFLFFNKISILSFLFFTSNIFLAMSSASNYLRTNSDHPIDILIMLALGIILLTAMNFSFGWLIGGSKYARETSNAIGQKNTMFAIWISLAFINPIVALGPMMYTVCHNLFVSYQLYKS